MAGTAFSLRCDLPFSTYRTLYFILPYNALVQLVSLADMGVSLPRDKETSVSCWSSIYYDTYCFIPLSVE